MVKKKEAKAKKGILLRVLDFRKRLPQEEREFWGPVSLTLGVIALANNILVTSNIFLINIVCGILFVFLGFFLMPWKQSSLWIRISIPVGFTIFFAGIRIKSVTLVLGWVGQMWLPMVIIGVLMMAIGFYKHQRIKAHSKNT